MANIFKLHQYKIFGLMKVHNMCKIWFANNIFSLLRWNKKYFSWVFKGFYLPEIVSDLKLRPELYWLLKENFCVISQKNLGGTDFQLLIILNRQNFLDSFLKDMLNIFSNFALVSHFSMTRFDILILCNILHIEMNFRNLH